MIVHALATTVCKAIEALAGALVPLPRPVRGFVSATAMTDRRYSSPPTHLFGFVFDRFFN